VAHKARRKEYGKLAEKSPKEFPRRESLGKGTANFLGPHFSPHGEKY
jgi:hypothetical protein